jgi:hypothetical protein
VLPDAEQGAFVEDRLVGDTVRVGGGGGVVQLHVVVAVVTAKPVAWPVKVNVPLWQGIEEATTVIDWPGESVPLDGVKLIPLRLLLAVQLTLAGEVEVAFKRTLHLCVLPVTVHWLLLVVRLVGLTTSLGGEQFHAARIVIPLTAVKVNWLLEQ